MSNEPPSQQSIVPTAVPIPPTPPLTQKQNTPGKARDAEEKSTQKSSGEEKQQTEKETAEAKEKENSILLNKPPSARITRVTSKAASSKSAQIRVESGEKWSSEKVKKREKSKKSERKNMKRDEEDEEMPKTADSEKEDEKKKKPKKKKSGSEKKEKIARETATSKGVLKESASKMSAGGLAKKESREMTVVGSDENLAKKKKKKKQARRRLKRETNHIFHIRPKVSKKVEFLRKRFYEDELKLFETGEFTYLTDPTRYRFRSTPPLELVIQLVFPSLLLLAIMLSCFACTGFLSNSYEPAGVITELSEMTLVKYDSFLVVDSIDKYIRNASVLRLLNCPGLVQSPYRPLDPHELQILDFGRNVVKKAMKAITYRWMYQIDPVMNMNFECPPSVLIEMYK